MFTVLFLISITTSFANANSYIATFPNSLIPGVNLETRVTVLGVSGPVQILASLNYALNDSEISSTSKQVSNGVPATLSIKVPEGLPLSQYKVSITGSGGLTFRNESKIRYEDNSLFIFLQTDKTRYSAGQTVRYRAILLHPNLLGYKGQFTITIFDGKDNKIEVNDHLKAKDGVVTGKLVLSREPVFGAWRINVKAAAASLTKNFEVNDYVVPRFSVEIVLPNGLKTTASSVDISVTARFTFNADVLGNCTLQIYDKQRTYEFVEYWKQIKGNVNFTIPMADLRRTFTNLYSGIIVRALVTDNATALTIAAEEDLTFKSDQTSTSSQDTLSITKTDKRDTFVAGLTYHTPIFVGYGEEPVGTAGVINVIPTVTTAEEKPCLLNNPPTKWLDTKTTTLQNFTIAFDKSGYAALNIPVSAHTDEIDLQLSYGTVQKYMTLYSVSSRPVTLLRMYVDKVHTRVGANMTIHMEATDLLSGVISYEIYARGILLKTVVNGLAHAKRTHIELEVTGDMVPQVYIVATHLTKAGNLLSDYVTLKVDGSPCKNKVSVSYNTTVLEPRGGLQIDIRADPNSTVYIMVEDEKNRLLGTENDVFLSEISDSIMKPSQYVKGQAGRKRIVRNGSPKRSMMNGYQWNLKHESYNREQRKLFRRSTSNVGEDIYHESGVIVLSDINMYKTTDSNNLLMFDNILPKKCIHITTLPPVTYQYGTFPTYIPGMVPTPAPGVTYAPSNIPTPAPGRTYAPGKYPIWVPPGITTPAPATVDAKNILRNRFPETWLWEEHNIGPSGRQLVIQTAPDSITSWVTSVFATNPDTGFGISDVKQKITVKKSFFLTMDLPPSIILGEEVLVQITVFNYMAIPQQVFLQIIKSDDPTHPIPAATMVKPNEGHSTYVRVTPKSLGTLKINVHAKAGFFSTSATDALEKEVLVLPLGVHTTVNEQHLVDVSTGGKTFTKTVFLKDDPNLIPGTKTVYLKVTGDFLVPSIKGLQNLIHKPVGCGEQTMMNLAPDVYLTKYMNITGQLTQAVEDRALQFIRSGYQHELGFKHYDGSFSIWETSSYGSTWLTAYVLKCFHQAKELVTIDDEVLSKAMNWLLRRQKNDGSFLEQLPVLYVDHRRTGTGIKLTAFTLIAILESKDITNVQVNLISSAIANGKHYLESRLSSISDAYTLSIVCYALSKSGSSYGSSCFSKLDSSKHIDGDNIYWTEFSPVVRRQNTARSVPSRAPARDIETTAYALLTYMALGRHADAFPIVKWLVSQRNPQGGFYTTQDTVITIQALTEYAIKHTQIAKDYGVQFNAFGMGFMHTYKATKNNYDSVHQVEVPSSLDNVVLQAMGDGVAVVDVIQSFFVNSSGNGTYISVGADIEKESLNSLTVKTVITWNGPSISHMILMEIEMPTGFVVDRDFFTSQAKVRKHETNGRKVAVYLDGIVQNGQTMVRVKMDRSDPVVKNQACHITVYDYYEPTQQAVIRYESGLLKRANICDVCPLCNFCTGSSGFPQIGIGK